MRYLKEEFENLSLDSFEDVLGLQCIDPDLNDDMVDIRDIPKIEYPFILLSGIEYINVLSLLYKTDSESCRTFNSWIYIDSEYTQIEPIALTFNTLLLMRNLGVVITIYASYDKVSTLNLNDPSIMEKYI